MGGGGGLEHDREESGNLGEIVRKTVKCSLAKETRVVGRVSVNQYQFGMELVSAKRIL